eukprot:TRINITY_DN6035_c0_g1_i1.p1 TRINITY_DN6035_c0_g1~~TRINITY_DN6035_c0_g1_i1.p1  ORF type:complete len:251 (-),score=35.66 TRINITY_DN6035_c0_g1_i1:200-952(-)
MLGEILSVQPSELKFPFELRKQVSTSLRLVNVTSEYVAFKVKTTSPKKYCVRPNTGLVPPQSSTEVVVTMQAQKEMPPDLQCKDKFLVQSVLVPASASKDTSQDFFNKENGRQVHEVKLRVVYVAPPQPPSPVAESAEEGAISPSPFPPTTKGLAPADPAAKDLIELKAKLTEAKSALAQVTDNRNSAFNEIKRLKANMSQQTQTKSSGFAFTTLLIVALVFFLIGFLGGKGLLPLPFGGSSAKATSTEL